MRLSLTFEVASIFVVRSEASHIVFQARFDKECPLLGTLQLEREVLLEVDMVVCVVALARKKDLDFTGGVSG